MYLPTLSDGGMPCMRFYSKTEYYQKKAGKSDRCLQTESRKKRHKMTFHADSLKVLVFAKVADFANTTNSASLFLLRA